MRRNEDLMDIINAKINNNGLLPEEEWKGIIYYLYETNDANLIEAKIIEQINSVMNEKIKNQLTKTKVMRDDITNLNKIQEAKHICYQSFIKIILDFQIKSRVNFLKIYTDLFKSVDSDNNGIISENEFLQLINTISFRNKLNLEPLSTKLLNLVDPFNNKQITYSDTINVLSKEVYPFSDGKQQEAILNLIVSNK